MTTKKPPIFITHKKSGEEGTYMGQTRMFHGTRLFRYAFDKSGRTGWLSLEQIERNWRTEQQ